MMYRLDCQAAVIRKMDIDIFEVVNTAVTKAQWLLAKDFGYEAHGPNQDLETVPKSALD